MLRGLPPKITATLCFFSPIFPHPYFSFFTSFYSIGIFYKMHFPKMLISLQILLYLILKNCIYLLILLIFNRHFLSRLIADDINKSLLPTHQKSPLILPEEYSNVSFLPRLPVQIFAMVPSIVCTSRLSSFFP